MDPFSLIALASAAGFVFKKMSGTSGSQPERKRYILPRRSKIRPGKLEIEGTGFDLDEIEVLPEYQFIKCLIDSQFPVVFVTGGAGTGKSTFVNWLMHHYSGNVLLTAPTMLAALNIDGRTMHSLFQLPLQWITQRGIKTAPYRIDIQKAKLLIIDEISMVNCNLLDGVSAFLRLNRGVDKPFGGLPVIMVGDLFQLPPVIRQGLTGLYDDHYGGQTKFYAARSLTETSMTYYAVELNKTFRQADEIFVDVLADIREGRNLEQALQVINSSCTISPNRPANAVWLAPRREDVERANQWEMHKLQGRNYLFEAQFSGNYHKGIQTLPSPQSLSLKVGTQVMFTRNDPEKRWVNGTIGIVREIGKEIFVETMPEGKIVKVARASWPNFQYKWNKKTNQIETHQTGSYNQYPLVHAWAITIHKSQGKTIEKVHLDLGRGTFASGQTYVALSRCRDLSGLSLSRPLNIGDIKVDRDSQLFNDHLHDLMEKLPQDKMLAALSNPPN